MTDTALAHPAATEVPSRAKPRARLAFLDGWRGLSIALVLAGHFFPVSGINLGLLGVEFFFVLSGRLMAEILFIERYPLKTFFKRRFSRIYPALLLFVFAAMAALSGSFIAYKWKAAATALTFTYNYAGILVNRAGALDHVWSLCVEEHSYVTLALVSLIAFRSARGLPLLLAGLTLFAMLNGAVSWWLLGLGYEATYWRTDTHIASILVSALVCLLKRDRFWRALLDRPWLAPLAALAGAALFADAVPMPLHYVCGTLLLAVAVNALDFSAGPLRALFSAAPAVFLGLWSYSLYLWQQPFYKFVYFQHWPAAPMLAGVFACALVSYYAVEKPARQWLNRNW
jgi:peptidoglycan/LPS O-acetylase OafA/YrhL